jgi:hypothetical protein
MSEASSPDERSDIRGLSIDQKLAPAYRFAHAGDSLLAWQA